MTTERTPLLKATALAVATFSWSLFAFLLIAGGQALYQGLDLGLLGRVWNPRAGSFGILPMVWNTILLGLLSAALAHLCARCLLYQLRPWALRPLFWAARIFQLVATAMPTVVWGFMGLLLLAPLVREALGGSGLSLLSAALMLTLQNIPVQLTVLDEATRHLEVTLTERSLALGFSPWQVSHLILWPALGSTRREAFLLGLGRALGDALIPVMVAGGAPQFGTGLLDSIRTLAGHIGLALSSEVTGGEHMSLLASGMLLLLLGAGLRLLGGHKS